MKSLSMGLGDRTFLAARCERIRNALSLCASMCCIGGVFVVEGIEAFVPDCETESVFAEETEMQLADLNSKIWWARKDLDWAVCYCEEQVPYFEDKLDKLIDKYNEVVTVAEAKASAGFESVKQAVDDWLERARSTEGCELGCGVTKDEEYNLVMEQVEQLCLWAFPELHQAVFGGSGQGDPGVDLIFKSRSYGDTFHLFYYNPDSNAGGQLVQCLFDMKAAERMVGNPDYFDVLCEYDQYLSDIATEHFFHDVFEMIQMKFDGLFLGTDVEIVCKEIVGQKGHGVSGLIEDALARSVEGPEFDNFKEAEL